MAGTDTGSFTGRGLLDTSSDNHLTQKREMGPLQPVDSMLNKALYTIWGKAHFFRIVYS